MKDFINRPQYRLVWFDMATGEYRYGVYLFDTPEQARETYVNLNKSFPECEFWVEDRGGKRIEIPS